MKKNNLSEKYWDNRYINEDTPWAINKISNPIKAYIDQLHDNNLFILIPGAGHGYEAEYLFKNGFTNVYINDFSSGAIHQFSLRFPDFPKSHILHSDFFEINMKFDLILEQTFFCAIDPSMRTKYISKVNELLFEEGKFVGLLFNFELSETGPPFGGLKVDYIKMFGETFNIKTLETAHNSVESRKNKELFFIFDKRQN